MTNRLLLVSGLLFTTMGTAGADVPGWCKVDGASRLTNNAIHLKEIYSETNARSAVQTLIGATCYPDSDTEAQAKQLEMMRQAWSKKLDMVDADWADAAIWAQDPRGRDIKATSDKLAWSAYSPIDQYTQILSTHAIDPSYLTDAFGAKLTEVGRLGYITKCLPDASFGDPGVRWAMCAPDIAAFDRSRFATELRSDTTHNGQDRMQVRFAAHEAIAALAKHAVGVKELLAKDPAYAKLFAISDATRKAWSPVPALVELVATMDDARVTGSRKASDGCENTTWAAWKTTVGAIPAKQFAGLIGKPGYETFEIAMAVVIGQPNGYLAALAMFRCGTAVTPAGQQPDYLTRFLGSLMTRWSGFRGPRTATQTAILLAGIALDDRNAKLDFPDVERHIEGNASTGANGIGAIASVKIDGAAATITFAKEKITQTVCAKGHSTNRITQLRSDGGVVYEYVCTEQRTETIAVAPSPPRTVQARYALGLTPGMVVTVVEEVVTFVHAKGKSGIPMMIAGVGVK